MKIKEIKNKIINFFYEEIKNYEEVKKGKPNGKEQSK